MIDEKVVLLHYVDNEQHITFWCPGCNTDETILIDPRNQDSWGWNGNELAPTFEPSVLFRWGDKQVCHCWVKEGKVEFLFDCTHELAGQTVDLPPLPLHIIEKYI